jgi:hypothetical protein
MKATSLKSIARHMTAISAGTVDKTNVIGIRKAINAMEFRPVSNLRWSLTYDL